MDEIKPIIEKLNHEIDCVVDALAKAIMLCDAAIETSKQTIRTCTVSSDEAKTSMCELQKYLPLLSKYKILLNELNDVNRVITKYLNGFDNIWLGIRTEDY